MTTNVGTLLWTAPEILKEQPYDLKVDVYSFAIVLWEIATRQVPFADISSAWAVRQAVVDGERPPIPEHAPPQYLSLMTICWSESPIARPTFAEAVRQLEYLVDTASAN